MFQNMSMAALIHKGRLQDASALPLETAIEMGTIRGARALGLEQEIGSLEAGKKADLIVLRSDSIYLTPTLNPVSNLLFSSAGRDVDTVVVDGQVLVQGRQVKTLDAGQRSSPPPVWVKRSDRPGRCSSDDSVLMPDPRVDEGLFLP
jgi:cytosine/adenosine deaminase-related metal-dependent hydrolase